MELGLTGKTALVLGASQGMGEAIARGLAAEGCNVIAGARRGDVVEKLAAELAATHGVEAQGYEIDLADKAAVETLCQRVRDDFKPDILLYNTGGPPPSGPLGVSDAVWQASVQSLLHSPIALCEAAVEVMQPRKWGRILTVASSGVQQPIPFIAVSNTVRSGFAAYAKTLSGAVAKDGITVNLLVPGLIATARALANYEIQAKQDGISPEEVADQSATNIPAGRVGSVQEFADVAVFLASERASYVTGAQIRIDGGSIRGI